MDIKRMHSEIKLRYNKLNSNHKKDFPTPYLDDFLNDAQNEFVEICYSGNNAKRFKLGFEFTQQRIDMLSSIVIPEEDIATTIFKTNIYKVNLDELVKNYRHYVSGYINTSCGKIKVQVVPYEQLESMLENDNTKPSKIWRRSLAVFGHDSTASNDGMAGNQSLFIYTGGEFNVDNATISYIKEPRKMFFSGYDTYEFINGDTDALKASDPQVNCQLPEVSHSLVVDIAVQLIARSIEDLQQIQTSEDKITRTI